MTRAEEIAWEISYKILGINFEKDAPKLLQIMDLLESYAAEEQKKWFTAAKQVAIHDWGTCGISEKYHFQRMEAMDNLRALVQATEDVARGDGR